MFPRFSKQSSALKAGVDQADERRQLAPGGVAAGFVRFVFVVVTLVRLVTLAAGRVVDCGEGEVREAVVRWVRRVVERIARRRDESVGRKECSMMMMMMWDVWICSLSFPCCSCICSLHADFIFSRLHHIR